MVEETHIALLDEGVDVWRPESAWEIGDHTYIVLRPDDYDANLETWQFPPGSTVVVENRKTCEGEVPAAIRPAQQERRSA